MRYILWSGGFDSTYLLCKWARESDECIQPVHVIMPEHACIKKQSRAIKSILPLLRAKTDVKAEIKDVIEIDEENLPAWEAYDNAYARYGNTDFLSGMYHCIGRVTLLYPKIAIGVEAPPTGWRDIGRVHNFMLEHGLSIDEEGNVADGVGEEDVLALLGGYSFPLLRKTEAEMLEEVKAWGYFEDIFQNIWTCDTPYNDPCGVCRACDNKLRSGDAFHWMFTKNALRMHEIKEYLKTLENGETYAEYFTRYGRNSGHIYKNDDDATDVTALKTYFDNLAENWPDVEGIDAPAL